MANPRTHKASTTAPVNIAVIKYWGKRDAARNLPTNSSLSVTLSQSDLSTRTTAACSADFSHPDTLILNNAPQDITSARPQACLRELRSLRASLESKDSSLPKISTYALRLVSVNNFPTAAGLASSAAGFAALVRAIANLYQLPQSPTELSLIARQGSGSACRSLMGGYVAWDMGSQDNGSDSMAREVAPRSHWPEMQALILVASAEKKDVSSTAGMQTTVKTSELFQERAKTVVPRALAAMEKAIAQKDFDAFATLTMRDSNSFHAVCLDTTPPIIYLNDISRAAIRAVDAINESAAKKVAAYTFDAGPNAVIYYLEENEAIVSGVFKAFLGSKDGWQGERGTKISASTKSLPVDAKAQKVLSEGLSRVILTSVGDGPVSIEDHLVDNNGKAVQ